MAEAKKPINKGPSSPIDQLLFWLQKPPATVKTNFFRLMAVSQESGLGVRESLRSILSAESNPIMKKILMSILSDVNQGSSLGYAFGCHPYFFIGEEVELINAAEKMGNIPETLKEIAIDLEENEKINGKISKAIMYPLGLLIFACCAVAILLIFVIPTITDLYNGSDAPLPAITTFMIDASDFLQKAWWMIAVGVATFIIVGKLSYAMFLSVKKLVDLALLKIPAVSGVVKTFYMYKFSKLLGDFGKAGVPPTETLQQMMNIFDNYHYKSKMLSMKKDLENGFTFSDSIEGSDLFDPILVQIVLVGEKTGNLSKILLTMSTFYRYQLGGKIDSLVGLIEPIMMGFIAGVIGAIVAAIFLPLGGLMDAVG